MASSASFLKLWLGELKSHGFNPQPTGGRNGFYASRTVGPLSQAIGALLNENRGGALNVQLNINMALPHSEPAHEVVILEGNVGRKRVNIVEPWDHDPRSVTWWRREQTDAAWAALASHGLDWLESYRRVEALVAHFEAAYEKHKSASSSGQTWANRLIGRLLGTAPKRAPGYHQYLLWLTMLYESSGQDHEALQRLTDYSAEVRRRGITTELPRLERHLQAIQSRAVRQSAGL